MNIARLRKGSENRKRILWPGTEEQVYIRVLAEGDYLRAEQHCDSAYRERGINLGNVEERSALKDDYCIYLAIVDEDGKRLFPDFDTFVQYLTPEIRNILISEQNNLQSEYAPRMAEMSDDEFDSLLTEIKKNTETVRNISDMHVLRRLIITMVSRQSKLPTAS